MSLQTVKKHLPLLLKLALAGVIFHNLFASIDFRDVFEIVKSCNPVYFGLAIVCIVGHRIFTAMKWHYFLSFEGIRVGIGTLIRITFISGFVGVLLPMGLGVDAVRLLRLQRETHGFVASVSATLADRIMSVITMVFLSLLGAAASWNRIGEKDVLLAVFVLSACALTGIAVALSNAAFRAYAFVSRKSVALLPGSRQGGRMARISDGVGKMHAGLSKLHHLLRSSLGRPRLLVVAFFLNAISLAMRIAIIHCLFRSIAVGTPVLFEVAFVPMILLLVLLPLSFAGLGVKEGAFVYFFSQAGVEPAAAIAVSLLTYVLQLLILIPGAVLLVLDRPRGGCERKSVSVRCGAVKSKE